MSDVQAEQPQPTDVARTVEPDTTVKPTVPGAKATSCPSCHIGVLFVIASDPDASHEVGNADAANHPNFEPSGGSQIVHCFFCGYQASQALGNGEGA